MSIKLMSMIFEVKGQLSPTEKLVMLELADHANDQGDGIWPGLGTIAERTSLSRTAVRDTLAWLTDASVLETTQEATATTSTRRRIRVDVLQEMLDLGNAGKEHPYITAARARAKAAAEAKKAAKQTGGEGQSGVAPADTGTPADTGIAPADTGYSARRHRVYHQAAQGVAPGVPESLINHPLNHQRTAMETGGGSSQKDPPFTEWWEMVKSQLRMEMSKADFDSWVMTLNAVEYKDGVFRLASINSYAVDWCNSRLNAKIRGLIEPLAGQPVKLVFSLARQQ